MLLAPLLLVFALLIPWLAYNWDPVLVRALLRDLRLPRIVFYIALGLLGIALQLQSAGGLLVWLRDSGGWRLALFVTCLVYAAVFAIVSNNIADKEADKITNPDRPLVRNEVSVKPYYRSGLLAQAIALALAASDSWALLGGIAAISLGYFVYSCPPFRLKRVPVVAKVLIGLNALSVVFSGFTLAGGALGDFPRYWILFILGPLSLSANFVDLKDTEGDRATGVWTLPVLLGESKARLFIACSTIATYAMGGWLLNLAVAIPLNAVLAGTHVWLLYRKPYREQPIFLVLLLALFGLSFFILLGKSVC